MKIQSAVWNLIRGGTEGQCARTVLRHVDQGIDHQVAVFRKEGFFLEDVERAAGPVYDIGIRKLVSRDTWKKIKAWSDYLVANQFDALHTWDADAAIFGCCAAKRAGIPLITSRRDLGAIYPFYKNVLMARADQQAWRVVANAHAIKTLFGKKGVPLEKIVTIPNMLEMDEFDLLRKSPSPWSRPDEAPVIISVARLDEEKDILSLIHAGALLKARNLSFHLVIAGAGPQQLILEKEVEKNLMGALVHFLGNVHQVPALLSEGDIGVLCPKANEGLSNTILEYMAASLPVVATECGGNSELVKEGETGLVVSVGQPEALAGALEKMLGDEGLRKKMGAEGRLRVERDFAPAFIADQFSALYAQAME